MRTIRKIIQYTLPLAIAFLLLGYAYRDFQLYELAIQLQEAKLSWIVLSIIISLASHVVRAYRWQLLLQTLGFQPSLFKTFIALMVGYVSNLLVPRLGEIVRCSALKRSAGIPTSHALGTVVAERAIDFVSLLAVVGGTLAIAFKQLNATLHEVVLINISPAVKILFLGSLLLIVLLVLLLRGASRSTSLQEHTVFLKSKLFLQEMLKGINSIRALRAKKTVLSMTALMWILYYYAGYVGVFAVAETAGLGWIAGLSILTISSISITLPIQGGIGAYHLLVSSTLMAYGITREGSMLYVTLMHSAQLLATIVVGGLSIILSAVTDEQGS
ncbi:MAG: lysylphosphatidylglycerol synthase transmembrane domain-containing protein [Bacteroidota bacterium]